MHIKHAIIFHQGKHTMRRKNSISNLIHVLLARVKTEIINGLQVNEDCHKRSLWLDRLTNSTYPQVKGALDNILKFSFWLNFIYHVKSDFLFTNAKRKKSKVLSESEEIINFHLGATSKPNRRLTGGSVRFRAVVIV